jgi:kanamycin kinase
MDGGSQSMKRTPISINPNNFPTEFHSLLAGADIYDSSCSPEASVIFIDKDTGYYLKSAPKGKLQKEAEMTRFFKKKGLGAAVLSYLSLECDWLLTERVSGEDCIHAQYLDNPVRLCDTTASLLRSLHETDPAGCPVENRTSEYLAGAERNYLTGMYDTSLTPDKPCPNAAESWTIVKEGKHLLKSDTLLHGDYCLPNIMLDNWNFSGFIDLGGAGVGDRHIDLFWGAWTLRFNLHTDRYRARFFDAYGRDKIDPAIIELIEIIERFG